MDANQAISAALAYFGETVGLISDQDWQVMIDQWSVKQVVAHVVVNDAQAASFLRGETEAWSVDADVTVLGSNPQAAWRGSALSLLAAADELDSVDRLIEMGTRKVQASHLLGIRALESAVHAADIRVAVGAGHEISDDLTDWLLEFVRPLASEIVQSDLFGPPVEVAIDANALSRLLALMGRKS